MKKVKAKFKKPHIIHSMGFCDNCGKRFDVFFDGISGVKKHVRETGHQVTVECGVYNKFYLVN